jgi:hypothetical protein
VGTGGWRIFAFGLGVLSKLRGFAELRRVAAAFHDMLMTASLRCAPFAAVLVLQISITRNLLECCRKSAGRDATGNRKRVGADQKIKEK